MAKHKRSAKQLANDRRLGRLATERAAAKRAGVQHVKARPAKGAKRRAPKHRGKVTLQSLAHVVAGHTAFIGHQQVFNAQTRDGFRLMFAAQGIKGPAAMRRLGSGR